MAQENRTARARKRWEALVDEQARSGQTVREFCREREIGEHSFYLWRRRLGTATHEPVRFALVERWAPAVDPCAKPGPAIELTLVSGEQLRIHSGVDAATLRTVLAVLQVASASR